VASDLLEMAFMLCGLSVPARFRAGASDVQVLAQGRWLEYTLRRGEIDSPASRHEHIPCIGELVCHWPRFLRSVEAGVKLVESSSRAADVLGPGLLNVEQAAHWFPAEGNPLVARIQRHLRGLLVRFAPGPPRFKKPDVRSQFTFPPPTTDASGRETRTAAGWLGIPSRVRKFDRDRKEHGEINKRFPDDQAGHLIARDFGAPADRRNLEPQNAVMNNSPGTYREREQYWAALLEQGYGIHVVIEVVTRPLMTKKGESDRPDRRHAGWKVIAPDGTRTEDSQTFLDRPIPEELREHLRQIGKDLRENKPVQQKFIPRIVRD
jgi:hypothetical protein